jgi:DNA-binding SARP family transcriptional activator
MPLLYSALGPLALRINGIEPVVPVGRDQVVLSMLLLNAGRAVTLENLIDAVWGGEPPGSAHGQVHSCVFRLRRTLPDGVLHTSSPGYLLEVDDGEFDVTVFQQTTAGGRTAVGQGRPALGSRLMRQGLALWRGPAFASVDSSVIRAEASGLDELRQAIWEECVETELQLGLGRELVGELTTLVGTYPLREEWRRLLMLALYRAGRQADALAVYQQARADLTDHLGVEPGPRLDDLHRRILRQDPSLLLGSGPATNGGTATGTETVALAATPVSGTPPSRRSTAAGAHAAQLPVAVNGYVGRKVELAQLDSILATADERAAGAVIAVIAGTAGVGKSAIAVHWAHRMRDKFPDGQLYVNLRGFDQNGPAMNPAEAVAGFLDALGMSGQQLPAGLAAQTAVYRSLLADRRVLVVLDNARDAEQVRPLLPGSAGCMALITSRNQMTTLLASEGAYLVPLDLISFAEARDLLAARLGEAKVASDPKAVEAIITCCARLPLALAVAAARAAARPYFPLAVLAQNLLDVKNSLDALDSHDAGIDIRATFSWSYQTLGPHASRLFRLLALLPGPHITPRAAASLGGLPAATTTQALAELSRAHLITEHSPGRFSFHDLLGAYAAELMQDVDSQEEQAAARQRMLDHYLHTACAAAMLMDPSRKSVSLARPHPQAQLTELADREEALAWFGAERPALLAAIQQAARTGFDVHTWQMAWTMADYCFYRGDWHGLAQTHEVALAAATRLADPIGMGHAHRGLAAMLGS